MKSLSLLIIAMLLMFLNSSWQLQNSGVTARLRGISAISERVAWASGASGKVLRTVDGGATWKQLPVTSEVLDFRDIDAISERIAYVLSIGNGPASRIYKTTDAGKTWTLQFKTSDSKAFLDAMSFWDATHGLVIGDSIDGRFYVLTTQDAGNTWSRTPADQLPPALENEGAFAASGTNIAVFGKTHAWIGTGAANKARVLHTTDGGHTWNIADTPLRSGPSSGIFSIAFRDAKHGVIVGGDYTKEKEAIENVAVTSDGGATWTLSSGLSGFRSVVAYSEGSVIAIGPSGTDISHDDGKTWSQIPGPGFDTFSFVKGSNLGWGSGAQGNIGKLRL
jgi:photosystem II stability/assembly factor-like uncharacterized protein